MVRGSGLTDFLARDENIRAMHPELQAEIAFGFDQSDDESANLLDLLDSFLKQDEDWAAADSYIEGRATELSRQVSHNMQELQQAARHEVACWGLLWQGDVQKAIEHALSVVDAIAKVPALNSYRALWAYLAASWAGIVAETTKDSNHLRDAEKLRHAAEGAGRTARWCRPVRLHHASDSLVSEFDWRAEQAARKLRKLGIRGLGFEQRVHEIESLIATDEAKNFELGLQQVGELLGFESVRPNAKADPDGAWRDQARAWLLFEAKTEEKATSPISVAEIRQALTHQEWVRKNLHWQEPESSTTAIVAYKSQVDETAASLSGDLIVLNPDIIRRIAASVIELHRELRGKARAYTEAELEAAFSQGFEERQLNTEELVAAFRRQKVSTLPNT
ncbi:MAG: hypothetical protein H0U53_09650 [Actinobacteria bacterium]|nr:hypothetical protein [Actinomycetota bacterium]